MLRLTFAVLLAALATAPGAAKDCPTLDGVEKLELLAKAPTCQKSLALFQDCSYVASGDTGLSEVVVKKCEADFLTKLGKSQRQSYDQKRNRCDHKYLDQSGTMYVSFRAFCRAELAAGFARRFARGSKP